MYRTEILHSCTTKPGLTAVFNNKFNNNRIFAMI